LEAAVEAISGAVRYRDKVVRNYLNGKTLEGDSETDLEAFKAAVHTMLEECFSGLREIGCRLPETVLPIYLDDVGQAERAAFHVLHSGVHWDDQAEKARGLLGEVYRKWLPLIPGTPTGDERGEGGKVVPEPKASSEDDSAYRPAKEMLLEPKFGTYKAINKALKANPWIRTRKPRKNRLLIHSGDWSKFANTQSPDPLDAPAAVVDAVLKSRQEQETIRKERRRK
jgi:hypothetical protein